MAPNPIMIPRKMKSRLTTNEGSVKHEPTAKATAMLWLFVFIAFTMSMQWARRWLFSGAAVESALLVYGSDVGDRVLADIPLWTLLATLNLVYAICSTSWLLNALFMVVCYILVCLTVLTQLPSAAHIARKVLRKTLGQHPHFIRDKLALFNLPALEIDTDVDGLFVIRGVTISFTTLTLVAHGIEVGLKLADDIELALYADEVVVRLFRRIEIGDVYANVKGGKFEMSLAGLDDSTDDGASEDTVFLDDTPLLRAATAGSKDMRERPTLRESFTGVSFMRDSSARDGLDMVKSLSPDDEIADKQYHEKLTEIRTTSAVYQSRQQVRHKAKAGNGFSLDDEQDMRAAVCAELHQVPSIVHPPQRSVRVTTLQRLSPPWQRRFMHRLPFLLRLLLAPLSYFHPIDIASINAAGSGQWVSALLQQQVFKNYTENSAELRRLHRKMSHWLADANFCLQLTDVQGLGHVSLSTYFDIVAYLKFTDVMAYRTAPKSGTISQVVRLGGADATFTIPSFLLPHHEHIVPPKPTPEDEREYQIAVEDADGTPNSVLAEKELKQVQQDQTNIAMSVHASLPASCDQSLLNFIAALVKATKIIEFEKEVDEIETPNENDPATPTTPDLDSDTISVRSRASSRAALSMKEVAGFKVFAKNIRQNLKEGTTSASIKEFAKELHQSTKDSMKKAMVGGLVNDRWIAKIVGKTAAMLQKAQGDVGYSGSIPIPLGPYRAEPGLPSKLLP